MREVVYMLDSNVLVDWMTAYYPDYLKKTFDFRNMKPSVQKKRLATIEQIRRFCEENENRIYIPDLVWIEFLSVVLHKEINVSGEFNDACRRIRNQGTLVQQIELLVRDSPHLDWLNWDSDSSPYPDAEDLLRETELIDRRVFGSLKRNSRTSRRTGGPAVKILDGMDSVILIYLNALALEETDKIVVLYSGDKPLCAILPRIRRYWHDRFSQNTAAVISLNNKIRCLGCGDMNSAEILRHTQISCKKCGRFPLKIPFR